MGQPNLLNGKHAYLTQSWPRFAGPRHPYTATRTNSVWTDVAWSSIPSDILRAELARRQSENENGAPEKPACGSGDRGAYDTPLHVFALFLILGLSTLGMNPVTDLHLSLPSIHSLEPYMR